MSISKYKNNFEINEINNGDFYEYPEVV